MMREQPQHVVYVIDGSLSMDEARREWAAHRVASLESVRPEEVRRTMVVFGKQAGGAAPFSTAPLSDPAEVASLMAGAGVNAGGTNLSQALLSALRPLAPSGGGRIILLSDGAQTEGDAQQAVAALRRMSVQVFPEAAPVSGAAATTWERVSVPPVVERGAAVPVRVVLQNPGSRPEIVDIEARMAGVTIARARERVAPGWRVATLSVPAVAQGNLELEVEVRVPGTKTRERRTVYTQVEGPAHILLVQDSTAAMSPLALALRQRDIEVSLVKPAELPETASPLVSYDALILSNIPKSAVSAAQTAALRSYLEDYGGGIFMAGLGGELADEVTTESPLDALLPVWFEAKGVREARRRVCMIMLIDRSASMLGPRIAATKRAAVALVNQLMAEDLVGVLAFDTKPYVIVEVQPAGTVGQPLINKLVRLRSSGGTDVFPALEAARERLAQTDAKVRHVILLSDGNTPFDPALYNPLVQEFRAQGTTVSTVAIGSVFINEDYLKWLAAVTGGTYYPLANLGDLPALIARDAQNELGRLPFTEGFFRPVRREDSDLFADVPAWPVLRGYVTATAKPGATVDLEIWGQPPDVDTAVNAGGLTPGADPLLARWRIGRGRVAVFTSDADTRWTPEWVQWPGFQNWAAQIARWVMRPRLGEEVFAWTEERHGARRLIVEGRLDRPALKLIPADAEAPPAAPALVQAGPWRWEASLEGVPPGWYALMIDAEGEESSETATRWLRVGIPPTSEEQPGQAPNEELLRRLAEGTGGTYGGADLAFLPPRVLAEVPGRTPLWWLVPVILLVLIDVWLRGTSQL